MQTGWLTGTPELVALVIALAGFVAASLAAAATRRAWTYLPELRLRYLRSAALPAADSSNGRTAARIVYFIVLGFVLLLAFRALGLSLLVAWLDTLIAYIPRLLLGGFIIFAGYLLSIVTREVVTRLLPVSAESPIPLLTQVLVIAAAVITGLGQMAIDVSFLATVTAVVVGSLLGALSLAFALGARTMVANLLASKQLDSFAIGDHVAIDDVEGQIVRVTPSVVVIAAGNRHYHVPCARFAETTVVQLLDSDDY